MNATATIPAGMVEVSKDEFYALLVAEPRDIMPTTEDRLCTWWRENFGARRAWGWDSTGYASPHGAAEVYAVVREAKR